MKHRTIGWSWMLFSTWITELPEVSQRFRGERNKVLQAFLKHQSIDFQTDFLCSDAKPFALSHWKWKAHHQTYSSRSTVFLKLDLVISWIDHRCFQYHQLWKFWYEVKAINNNHDIIYIYFFKTIEMLMQDKLEYNFRSSSNIK